ncbi:MAG: glycosyltransferase family 2 protein [Ornithinibacter sp.]
MIPNPLDASVIVPSHRGTHRLPALLDALARQDHPGPWEVLVVLDGVLDDSPEVLEGWQARLPLRVLRSEEPRGVVAALNDGFAAARGRVLIRCDDDLTPEPHMVRGHVENHRGRDDLGVSCAMRDVVTDTPYARTYGAATGRRRLEQWYTRPAALRWVDWSAHNSVTRAAWQRLDHGFDPRFVYGQDSELGYRLARSGVRIVVDPALEIEHRGAALSAANRVPRAYVAGASRALFERVHGTSHAAAEPAPASAREHVWATAVAAVAWALRDWSSYQRLGRVVERSAPRLPRALGSRLVALATEAAGRAGRLHGPTDLSTLTTQKVRELDREREVRDVREPPAR